MSGLSKVAIVPLEGDASGSSINTMFNPKELSFTKSVGWSDDSVGCGTDYPALAFTAGQAITLSVEFFFDAYESGGDVRGSVKSLVHLCEIQDCGGGQKRPPMVQLVWCDADPIGVGNFKGVVESAQAKYTMFTNSGVPCRASVTVSIKQADVVGTATKGANGMQNVYDLSKMNSNQARSINGMQEAMEQRGEKIEDESTWQKNNPITVGGGSGSSEKK